jgi:hypothetical protein
MVGIIEKTQNMVSNKFNLRWSPSRFISELSACCFNKKNKVSQFHQVIDVETANSARQSGCRLGIRVSILTAGATILINWIVLIVSGASVSLFFKRAGRHGAS